MVVLRPNASKAAEGMSRLGGLAAAIMAASLAVVVAGLPERAPGQDMPAEDARREIRQILHEAEDALVDGADTEAMGHLFDALYNLTNVTEVFVTRAVLTRGAADGFGQYEPRGHNAYAPGEPIHLYIEPLGLDFRRTESRARAELEIDYRLLNDAGDVVERERNFLAVTFESRTISFDNYIAVEYRFPPLPTGAYRLETVLRDGISGDQIAVESDIMVHGSPSAEARQRGATRTEGQGGGRSLAERLLGD